MSKNPKDMKHTLTLLALATLLAAPASGQNCLPEGIVLGTQWQVDNFASDYPGCTHIQGSLTITLTDNITNLWGLSQITSIGKDLHVAFTQELTNLDGLNNLTTVGRDIYLQNPPQLTDISALSNVTSVGRDLLFTSVPLASLNGLGSLTTVGRSVHLVSLGGLTDLTGLEGLQHVGRTFSVENNSSLVSLNGVSLQSTGGFGVKNNPQLTDLSAASGLTALGTLLNIEDNASLTTLEDLSGITEVGGYIRIRNNPLITDLSPLANIDPTTITALILEDLPGVSDCALANFCAYLGLPDADATIANNGTGCASVAEVEAACFPTAVGDVPGSPGTALRVFPNPSDGLYHVQAPVPGDMLLSVIDLSGRIVHSERIIATGTSTHALELTHLGTGIYILRLDHPSGPYTTRLVRH